MGVFGARPRVLGFLCSTHRYMPNVWNESRAGGSLSEAALPCSGDSVAHLLVGHTCLYWTS